MAHTETRRFAYNVNPEEGNLKMVDGPQLESRLAGVKYRFHHAADAFFDSDDPDQADLRPHDSVRAHCVVDRRATAGLRDQLPSPSPRDGPLMLTVSSMLFARCGNAASVVDGQDGALSVGAVASRSPNGGRCRCWCLIVAARGGVRDFMYRRDSVELRPGIGVLLAVLRLAAFAGLLLAYLDLQKWSEQQEVQKSRVILLGRHQHQHGAQRCRHSRRHHPTKRRVGNRLNTRQIEIHRPKTSSAVTSAADTRLGQVVSEFTSGRLLERSPQDARRDRLAVRSAP